jgi:hypothetical protein
VVGLSLYVKIEVVLNPPVLSHYDTRTKGSNSRLIYSFNSPAGLFRIAQA